jgi:hypothetical protein
LLVELPLRSSYQIVEKMTLKPHQRSILFLVEPRWRSTVRVEVNDTPKSDRSLANVTVSILGTVMSISGLREQRARTTAISEAVVRGTSSSNVGKSNN